MQQDFIMKFDLGKYKVKFGIRDRNSYPFSVCLRLCVFANLIKGSDV